MSQSVLVLCHGSQDPRYQAAFAEFVHRCQRLMDPIPVQGGQLELANPPLAEQICQIIPPNPDPTLVVVPVFMGGGIHLNQDIPDILAVVIEQHPHLRVVQTPALGQVPEMAQVVEQRIRSKGKEVERWILLSHGSRQPEFAKRMQALVVQVGEQILDVPPMTLAYWSQPPSLTDQITALYDEGYRRLQVLPFFFFPGGILEQLQQQLTDIHNQYPDLVIGLDNLLLPDPFLVEAVCRLVHTGLSSSQPLCTS